MLCRKVIADAVLADSSTYNEAFLGKKPQEYASWIKDSSKWGGAIELSILSKYACHSFPVLLLLVPHTSCSLLASNADMLSEQALFRTDLKL